MRIKEIREAKGMTAAELAKAVNTTPVSISRYETGKRKPSIFKAAEIAKVLNVTVDELIGKKAG
jgi:transcriptional regulator with XRE-family HTH domain